MIDVDEVVLKRQLYAALAQDGRSLKEWFVATARDYLEARIQGQKLDFSALQVAETAPEYRARQHKRTSGKRKLG